VPTVRRCRALTARSNVRMQGLIGVPSRLVVWAMRASLMFVIVVGLCLGSGAQSEPLIPDACRQLSADALSALEARRTALESDLKRKVAAKARDEDLRKGREELLDVLYQIECRNAASAEPVRQPRTRAPVSKAGEIVEVTTYYATNRKPSAGTDPVKVYGSEFDSSLQFGRAVVTVPATHTPGNLEMPSLWKLEREPDPTKHFVLKAVLPLSIDAARKEMAERLNGTKPLLVFVHGYNMGFAETALRTAQMAHDLSFPGIPFFYSWPSANSIRAYWQDEELARRSERVFEQLIEELNQLPVRDIYIVAHSMGNRIVGHALERRALQGKETKNLRGLLLAAPDINADLFQDVIAPKLAAMQGTRTTIYASSSDLALRASKIVHGVRRVGETVDGKVFTYPGIETIDASGASAMSKGYGHFYLVDSPSVLKDMQTIMEKRLAAKLQGLFEMGTAPKNYYRLQ
jgi:esterase/lipase superfamily enzyme